nr:39S ribosomal protein L42, mitochondrial [Leptinotarsa decemlineata]
MRLKLFLTPINTYRMMVCRYSSSNKDPKIVPIDEGSTLLAWHPKKDFPYECTKPLPEKVEFAEASVLKTTLTPEVMSIFNKKTPEQARQELMNITHTTKHRWFPRARDKRAKKTPMDRPYL